MNLEGLAAPLRRLDLRLADAFAATEHDLSPLARLEQDLARPAGTPRFTGRAIGRLTDGADGRLAALAARFGLDPLACDLLLLALAPEIDARYAQAFAALQGDPAAIRPGRGLALDLLCADAPQAEAGRAALLPEAPLLRRGLLRAEPEDLPWPLQPLQADGQVLRHLLGDDAIPPVLATFATLHPARRGWRDVTEDAGIRAHLARLARLGRRGPPLRCVLQGEAAETRPAAAALAGLLGVPLLAADLAGQDEPALRAALLAAGLRGALALLGGLSPTARATLDGQPVAVAIATAAEWPLAPGAAEPMDVVRLTPPGPAARLVCWQRELAAARLTLAEEEVATLAGRFTVSAELVRAACRAAARHLARAPGAQAAEGAFPLLLRLVRAGRGGALEGAAKRLEGSQAWDDLVLPPAQTAQLHELCAQVAQRQIVEEDWGFAGKLALGRGICALFAGPSGTGKTMAAGIVARALHLDLYRIDLAQTVSKFIGETEKNLDRIFAAAQAADAVLFFDEADALFGKRAEVKDAHDRYANLEVSYLLQKMEEYSGLAILATNLRQHLDEAFTRRLRVIVEFPFPDEADRLRIWRTAFPRAAPLADDVDLAALARQVRLAGGNIRNIALAAAYLAASDGNRQIAHRHLVRAARAEYAKIGRTWAP